MRKLITVLAIVIGIAAPASARSPRPQVDTNEFAVDRCTSTTISISTSVATDVVAASVFLDSATFLEVYNCDSSAIINGGFESDVSTTSSKTPYGREIAARVGVGFLFNLDRIARYFVMSQGTSSTRATITKCR